MEEEKPSFAMLIFYYGRPKAIDILKGDDY